MKGFLSLVGAQNYSFANTVPKPGCFKYVDGTFLMFFGVWLFVLNSYDMICGLLMNVMFSN